MIVLLGACRPAPRAAEIEGAASEGVSTRNVSPTAPNAPQSIDRLVFQAISLGKRVSLPYCADADASQACIDSGRTKTSPTRVYIPGLASRPHYYPVIAVLEIDGTAEAIFLNSGEQAGADEAMRDDFVRAFGEPGSIGRDETDNSEWARWRAGDLNVFWFGRADGRPFGAAAIETAKGELYSAEEQARIEANTPQD